MVFLKLKMNINLKPKLVNIQFVVLPPDATLLKKLKQNVSYKGGGVCATF